MTPARSNTMEEMPSNSSSATLTPDPDVSSEDLKALFAETDLRTSRYHQRSIRSLLRNIQREPRSTVSKFFEANLGDSHGQPSTLIVVKDRSLGCRVDLGSMYGA
jgi:hypothetical protein